MENDFQGVEAPWPLALAQKLAKTQNILGSGATQSEGGGTQGKRRNLWQANPQWDTVTWVQAEGGKGGEKQTQDTSADSGT